MARSILSFLAASVLAASAAAQTFSACNPTINETCPANPALGKSFNETFNSKSTLDKDNWHVEVDPAPVFPDDDSGAAFTITKQGDAPTVQSTWYIFWGHFEILLKAASGQGIISSVVLLSDDLDEIDWEMIGGNTTHVSSNYYGKGDRNQTNGEYHELADPQKDFHNYTVNWDSSGIEWLIDGNTVRKVIYSEAVDKNNKTMFPQTPMRLKLGNWAGGDPNNAPGVIAWAGGETDYSQGPFVMTVKDVNAVDGTRNATEYKYGDKTGSWESIEVTKTDQPMPDINEDDNTDDNNDDDHSESVSDRWGELSDPAKIGIIVGGAVVGFVLFVIVCLCCVRQRRRGKSQRNADLMARQMGPGAEYEKEQWELNEYNRVMGAGGYGAGSTIWRESAAQMPNHATVPGYNHMAQYPSGVSFMQGNQRGGYMGLGDRPQTANYSHY